MKNVIIIPVKCFLQKGAVVSLCFVLAGSIFSCKENFDELGCDWMEELYYYRNGEKEFLADRSPFLGDWLLVGFELHVQNNEIVHYIRQTGFFKPVDTKKIYRTPKENYLYKDHYNYLFVNTKNRRTCTQQKEIIRILEMNPIVMFVHPVLCSWDSDNCKDMMSYTEHFYVKVKDKDDLADFYDIVQETNTWIYYQSESRPEWFSLRANKHSKGNALKMANYFYETGKFVYAECNFFGTGSVLD